MNRFEYKFLISNAESVEIARKMAAVFERDGHGENYAIRSLYFDDYNYSAYYDKLDGVPVREKFRLRFYNGDDSFVSLECKEKHGNKVRKMAFTVTRSAAESFIAGDFSPAKEIARETGNDTADRFYARAVTKGFRPAAVTDYKREAFVHPSSRMRITFDRELSTLTDFDIFDSRPSISVLTGGVIMEVKYDDVLPILARELIPPFTGQAKALSKYCFCRKIMADIRG
jgi:SPX domain protein involved in polyphosphate accumulation